MKHLLLFCLLPLLTVHADLTEKFTAAASQKDLAVPGEDSWLFLKQEMAHLAKGPLTAEATAPAVKAITAYHTALAAEGVQLIVLPVPAKAEIYPDKFSAAEPPRSLVGRQTILIQALEQAGVNVIDLAGAFHAEREKHPETLLYCARDAHGSAAGVKIAADFVKTGISDQTWFKPALPLADPVTIEITGDLMASPATATLGAEKLTVQRAAQLMEPAADAPAILLGDSHTLAFSGGADAGFHCQGAGLLDLLQAATGQAWMQAANAGGGTDAARMQLARKALPKPNFWKNKKVVVWCFSIREITEKKWSEVPIKK